MTTLSRIDNSGGARIYNQVVELEGQQKRARGPESRNLRSRLRNKYVELLLTDTKFALERNITSVLWHNTFYLHISELKNRAASSGAELQKLKNFLSEGIQFYLGLIRKVRKKYGLPPENHEFKGPEFDLLATDAAQLAECLKTCHWLFLHLGDLCRYKEQYPDESTDLKVPAGYYYKAIVLWPSNGHPHNQLAVLATYLHNDFVAVYHYLRSLAVREPSDTAKANLSGLFQKNRQYYDELSKKPLDIEDSEAKVKKRFSVSFVRLCGILYTKSSVDDFAEVYDEASQLFERLLSYGVSVLEKLFKWDLQNQSTPPASAFALATVQIVSMLICSVPNNTYAGAVQASTVSKLALTAAFKFAACFMSASAKFKKDDEISPLAGSLVFMDWLGCRQDANFEDDRLTAAKSLFWKENVAMLNCFPCQQKSPSDNGIALWEDHELRGFAPLATVHARLDFGKEYPSRADELQGRVYRFVAAAKAVAKSLEGSGKDLVYDEAMGTFFLAGEPRDLKLNKETSSPTDAKASLVTETLDDEEEVIVFKPAAKATSETVQNHFYDAPRQTAAGTPSPGLQQAAVPLNSSAAGTLESSSVTSSDLFNSVGLPVSTSDLFRSIVSANLVPTSSVAVLDGAGTLPPGYSSTGAGFGALPSAYGTYGFPGAQSGAAAAFPGQLVNDAATGVKDPALPYASQLVKDPTANFPGHLMAEHSNSAYTSSLAQDFLFKLQNASLDGSFARQATNSYATYPVDYLKPSSPQPVSKDETSNGVVRPNVRPPPGFGPIPSRGGANKPVAQPREEYKMMSNETDWLDNYTAVSRPLFGTDFGIWSSSSNGVFNNANISLDNGNVGLQLPKSTAASYPFPGMGVRTLQQIEQSQQLEQQRLPQPGPVQQLYGNWKPDTGLGYEPGHQSLQQHEAQVNQEHMFRQYRPPDPFVS